MAIPANPSLVATWQAQPALNMAVATGAVSGIIVLDCDSLLSRCEVEARGIPETLTVATPRGTHYYFQHPGWPVSNRAGHRWAKMDGLDLRGDGGYVVGPGSYFVPTAMEVAKGKVEGAYTVEIDVPPAQAPDWLLELIMPHETERPVAAPRIADETSAYGRGALNSELLLLTSTPSGGVNDQINLSSFAIAQLVAGGEVTEDEGWGALMEALATLGVDGEEKANGTALRGWAAGLEHPRAVEHKEPIDLTAALGTRARIALTDDDAVPRPPAPRFRPAVKPQYIGGNELLDYFPGVVYVVNRNEMFVPSGVLLKAPSFDGLYGGPSFVLDADGGKKTRSAWQMFRENSQLDLPKVWDICFRPELPPGQILDLEGLPYLNIYVPVHTPRQKGNPGPFLEHVHKLLPHGNDALFLLHWMASAVQNPGRKFFWWPVIQGTKGNGKSLLLSVMAFAIGERYSHRVRADAVLKTGNQFNDWLVGKLFLGFEEIRSSEGRRDFVEVMKDTVTDSRVATEGKGAGQKTSDNRANGMMLTNWKDACPVDDDERRWGMFFTAQQTVEDVERDGMGGDYFPRLYDWLRDGGYAIVNEYLATFPLVAEMDPAQKLHRAPQTSSTMEAVSESLGMVEQEIQEAIETGLLGFREGVVTSTGLRALLDRMRKTIAPKRYAGIMKSLGYGKHPSLEVNRGRPTNALADGSRPVLYFHKDHPILSETNGATVKDMVEKLLFGELPGGNGASNVVPLRR